MKEYFRYSVKFSNIALTALMTNYNTNFGPTTSRYIIEYVERFSTIMNPCIQPTEKAVKVFTDTYYSILLVLVCKSSTEIEIAFNSVAYTNTDTDTNTNTDTITIDNVIDSNLKKNIIDAIDVLRVLVDSASI